MCSTALCCMKFAVLTVGFGTGVQFNVVEEGKLCMIVVWAEESEIIISNVYSVSIS